MPEQMKDQDQKQDAEQFNIRADEMSEYQESTPLKIVTKYNSLTSGIQKNKLKIGNKTKKIFDSVPQRIKSDYNQIKVKKSQEFYSKNQQLIDNINKKNDSKNEKNLILPQYSNNLKLSIISSQSPKKYSSITIINTELIACTDYSNQIDIQKISKNSFSLFKTVSSSSKYVTLTEIVYIKSINSCLVLDTLSEKILKLDLQNYELDYYLSFCGEEGNLTPSTHIGRCLMVDKSGSSLLMAGNHNKVLFWENQFVEGNSKKSSVVEWSKNKSYTPHSNIIALKSNNSGSFCYGTSSNKIVYCSVQDTMRQNSILDLSKNLEAIHSISSNGDDFFFVSGTSSQDKTPKIIVIRLQTTSQSLKLLCSQQLESRWQDPRFDETFLNCCSTLKLGDPLNSVVHVQYQCRWKDPLSNEGDSTNQQQMAKEGIIQVWSYNSSTNKLQKLKDGIKVESVTAQYREDYQSKRLFGLSQNQESLVTLSI